MSGRRSSATPPPLYGDQRTWGLIHGDSLSLLRGFPADTIPSAVIDPPYGLSMAAWDGGTLADGEGFEAFTTWWARELLRVLTPGAWCAVHAVPRQVHRLVCGLENAGFEVRDQLLWCFTSVPKAATGLRPMYEPIVLVRKPLAAATVAANVRRFGTGPLNIDSARIERPVEDPGEKGYWPPNLVMSHVDACAPKRGECVPDCPLPLIDRIAARERQSDQRFSRLFVAAKASRAEREAGCEHLPARAAPVFSGARSAPRRNIHNTVKPLSLMRWLVNLITPPGALVLDCFAGSGTTGAAALLEGRQFIGVECEAEYAAIARARLAHWATVAAKEAAG